MAISYHQVLIAPLKDDDTYDTEVDVTDFVILGGIGNVAQSIDSGNYDIGLYTYADLTLTFINYSGKFNDNTHSSSMFFYTRDRALVTINFFNEDGAQSVTFKGLVNDEATNQDLVKDTIKMKILSRDSILRKTKVPGGLINDGELFSSAIKTLLNRPAITNVILYNETLISVGIDFTIDDASVFSDKDTRTVLEELLNASGSVFRINNSDEMVVSSRDVTAKASLELFGGGDPLQRDNITSIKSFNDGLQRTFNTVTINGQSATSNFHIDRYGSSIKDFSLDSVTNTVTLIAIAQYLLDQFKDPKNELEVIVPVTIAEAVEILDPVTINFAKKYIGYKGARVPVAGVAIAGVDIVPISSGGIVINDNKTWKVTAITQDTKKFVTTLRLREI